MITFISRCSTDINHQQSHSITRDPVSTISPWLWSLQLCHSVPQYLLLEIWVDSPLACSAALATSMQAQSFRNPSKDWYGSSCMGQPYSNCQKCTMHLHVSCCSLKVNGLEVTSKLHKYALPLHFEVHFHDFTTATVPMYSLKILPIFTPLLETICSSKHKLKVSDTRRTIMVWTLSGGTGNIFLKLTDTQITNVQKFRHAENFVSFYCKLRMNKNTQNTFCSPSGK